MRFNVHIPLAAFLVLWAQPCLTQAGPAQANVSHVEIERLRSDKGQVLCALYSRLTAYPRTVRKRSHTRASPISDNRASREFSGVKPGMYTVSVFDDENSNGKLDTNLLGIPREGVGASNDATGHFGPPKFDDAAFQFSGGPLNLKITINYL